MKIILIILLIIVLASVLGYFLFQSDDENYPISMHSQRHNLILIVSDALRYDILGCYGGDAQTPHIDWLAENGTLFEKAYSTSPWTSPSSVSMFTGNYPSSYRDDKKPNRDGTRFRRVYAVPDDELLLCEALAYMDYETVMHVENPYAKLHNNLQGFSSLVSVAGLKDNEKRLVEQVTGIQEIENTRYGDMYSTLLFLLEADRDKPFCLLKWILDPHAPYEPPLKYRSKIEVGKLNLQEDENYYSSVLNTDKCSKELGRALNEDEQIYLKALYRKEVESMDERVGYILSALKYKEMNKNTFIVLTSDHGEHFGEHGLFCHSNSYYDELIHIPLIIVGPGISEGFRIAESVSLLDLMPTLKALLGISYPEKNQGKSLKPIINGKSKISKQYYIDGIKKGYGYIDALIDNEHKMVAKENNVIELYNMINDPDETNNIYHTNIKLANVMHDKLSKIREINELLKAKKYKKGQRSSTETDTLIDETDEQLRALGY